MSSSAAERDPIEELADSFVRRLRAGEHPAVEEYIARYPEVADQVRDLLSALVLMEQNQTASGGDAAADMRPGDLIGRHLGEYRIVREVGRGGMGVVYEAVQESLGRRVALKILPARLGTEREFLERFRREAKAAAGLHHTNIVPVFGVGEHQGTHFYAMQFIEGRGLDRVLEDVRQRRQPQVVAAVHAEPAVLPPVGSSKSTVSLPAAEVAAVSPGVPEHPLREEPTPLAELAPEPYFRAVAHLMVQAADGLHYAHQHSVLHRDIKPSNLLLDPQNTVWITDFGLAKTADSENLTETGDILGTLRYMAPERFRGEADARSDVYALGVTLYELLTLRPAYADTDRFRLIERIQRADRARPRQMEPRLPLDLETIVLKAMEPEPAARYATAADLGEDLRRFLADRPIRARRISALEQLNRWRRRNPALARLTATVALLLVLLAAGSLVAAVWLREQWQVSIAAETQALQNLALAQQAEQERIQELYRAYVNEARVTRSTGRVGQRLRSLEILEKTLALVPRPSLTPGQILELREEIIAALALPDLRAIRHWSSPARPSGVEDGRFRYQATDLPRAAAIDFDPLLRYYAAYEGDGNVVVRRVVDDTPAASLPLSGRPWQCICRFSPNGQLLLVDQSEAGGHLQGPLAVWNWRGGRKILEVAGGYGYSRHAFSCDSRRLALVWPASSGRTVALYDLASGKEEKGLAGDYPAYYLAFNPDGRRLAMTSLESSTVRVVDLHTGEAVTDLPQEEGTEGLAWSADGQRLAVGGWSGRITVWDLARPGNVQLFEGHRDSVFQLAFDQQGTLLMSASMDGTSRLWDLPRGRALLRLPGRIVRVRPDNGQLASVDDTRISLWERADDNEFVTLPQPARTVDFSPDGRLLATAGESGAHLWDVATRRPVADLGLDECETAVFNPRDGTLATYGKMSRVRLWPWRADPAGPRGAGELGPPLVLPIATPQHRWQRACWSRDGRWLGVVDYRNDVVLIAAADQPQPWRRLGKLQSLALLALSPDGAWAAAGAYDWSRVQVWRVGDGAEVFEVPGQAYAAFSPNGEWLVTGGLGHYSFWHVGSWQPGPELVCDHRHPGPAPLAFSADGRLLALAMPQVRLVDAATGNTLATLTGPDSTLISGLCFSPDGSRLAVARHDREVQLWDLRSLRRQLSSFGLDYPMPPYEPPTPSGPPEELRVRVLLPSGPDQAGAWTRYWLRRGQTEEVVASWSDAIESYTKALKLLPSSAPQSERAHVLDRRAQSYWRSGCYEAARADWLRALELAPEPDDVRLHLARSYVVCPPPHRSPHRALPLALAAVEHQPVLRQGLNTLGITYYRLGKYQEAADVLGRSLRERNHQTAAQDLFFLAMCSAKLGDPEGAKKWYEEAVQQFQKRKGSWTAFEAAELKDFHAEAESILAGDGKP
jgi:serine/threonine protein kinase/WD40 repeat protein/Tfp pilus assembly protein PilF